MKQFPAANTKKKFLLTIKYIGERYIKSQFSHYNAFMTSYKNSMHQE